MLAIMAFGLVTVIVHSAEDAKLESADFYESKAFEQQTAVQQCELMIDDELMTPNYTVTENYRYTIDRDKILQIRHAKFATGLEQEQTDCRNCYVQGMQFKYGFDGGNHFATFFTIAEQKNMDIGDPRKIGFMAQHFLNDGIRKIFFVGNPDSMVVAVKSQVLNGLETVVIERKLHRGDVVKYWIAPSQGYGIVRFELDQDKRHSWATTTLKYHEKAKLWFPEAFTGEHTNNGKFERRFSGVITVKSINEPLGKEKFEIPAYGLPLGTTITNVPPNGETVVWNGIALTAIEDVDPTAKLPVFSPEPKWIKWLWRCTIALGGLAVLLGLQLLLRRFRKRSQETTSS